MKVKLHINWRKVVVFLLISAGLVFLTRSLLMSIGILLLLFVIDALLANYEYRKKTHAFFEDLRREQEQRNKAANSK